ncbi:hypothetical protein D3H64_03345 [Atopobacter sp. AH10]|uniref:AAA family ATPase n=1 Tax=Atopobacter sp. AH10 TaxID=2315861 RepID=UPI000EF1E19C|nr:AAA family ATPase [Atopobacter sp. AH10]RLK63652.1 hypothetical protein D3H64_03345 [Atopobacter sp. AH10]
MEKSFRLTRIEVNGLGAVGHARLDFPLERSIVGIMGPNGTGKSTFLSAIRLTLAHLKGFALDDFFQALKEGEESGEILIRGLLRSIPWTLRLVLTYGSFHEIRVKHQVIHPKGITDSEVLDAFVHQVLVLYYTGEDGLYIETTRAEDYRYAINSPTNIRVFKMDGAVILAQKADWPLLRRFETQMNHVLSSLAENASIEIVRSTKGYQLLVNRPGLSRLFDRESEGIRHLIMKLTTLIAVYNQEGTVAIVDHLDDQLDELIFGQLLEVIDKKGKGQLLFSSPSLRGMEILSPEQVYISTHQASDRLKQLTLPYDELNLRDYYLRLVALSDSDGVYHSRSEVYDIKKGFERARG